MSYMVIYLLYITLRKIKKSKLYQERQFYKSMQPKSKIRSDIPVITQNRFFNNQNKDWDGYASMIQNDNLANNKTMYRSTHTYKDAGQQKDIVRYVHHYPKQIIRNYSKNQQIIHYPPLPNDRLNIGDQYKKVSFAKRPSTNQNTFGNQAYILQQRKQQNMTSSFSQGALKIFRVESFQGRELEYSNSLVSGIKNKDESEQPKQQSQVFINNAKHYLQTNGQFKNYNSSRQNDLQEYKSQLAKSKQQMDKLVNLNQRSQKRVQYLQQQLKAWQQKVLQKQNYIVGVQSALQKNQDSLRISRSIIFNLNQKINNLNSKFRKLEEQNKELLQLQQQLQGSKQQDHQNIERLRNQLIEITEQNIKLNLQISAFHENKQTYRIETYKAAEVVSLQKQISQLKEEISELKKEISIAKSEAAFKQRFRNQQFTAKQKKLQQFENQYRQALEEEIKKIQLIEQESQDNEQMFRQFCQPNQSYEFQQQFQAQSCVDQQINGDCNHQKRSLATKINQLTSINRNLNAKVEQLCQRQIFLQLKQLRQKITKNQSQKNDLQKNFIEVNIRMRKLAQKCTFYKAKIDDLQDMVTVLQTSLQNTTQDLIKGGLILMNMTFSQKLGKQLRQQPIVSESNFQKCQQRALNKYTDSPRIQQINKIINCSQINTCVSQRDPQLQQLNRNSIPFYTISTHKKDQTIRTCGTFQVQGNKNITQQNMAQKIKFKHLNSDQLSQIRHLEGQHNFKQQSKLSDYVLDKKSTNPAFNRLRSLTFQKQLRNREVKDQSRNYFESIAKKSVNISGQSESYRSFLDRQLRKMRN